VDDFKRLDPGSQGIATDDVLSEAKKGLDRNIVLLF